MKNAVEFLTWFLNVQYDWQSVADNEYRKEETGQNISGEELYDIFLHWLEYEKQ